MKRSLFILYLLTLSAFYGYGQNRLVGRALEETKAHADVLNDKKRFVEAFKEYSSLRLQLEEVAQEHGVAWEAVTEGDFLFYMNVLTGMAETAYMMDAYTDLTNLCETKRDLLIRRMDTNPLEHTESLRQWAYYHKELGNCYYGMPKRTEHLLMADSLYQLAEHALGNESDKVPVIKMERAQLYYKYGAYDKACALLEEFLYRDDEEGHLYAEAYAISCARNGDSEEGLKIIDFLIGKLARQHSARLPELYRKKGKMLMLHYDQTGVADWEEMEKCYTLYFEAFKKNITKELKEMTEPQREQHWLTLHDFLYDCCRLEQHAPALLYDVALFAKGFLLRQASVANGRASRGIACRWTDVQKALTEEGCAIEFLHYNGKDERKQLGALVVTKKGTQPQFIHLGAAQALKGVTCQDQYTIADLMMADGGVAADAVYGDSAIFNKVWTPSLMEAIGDARKVYFAPDGLLHQLAIEYMMPDTTKVCYRLTSTRNLTTKHRSAGRKMLLCGGIDYLDTSAQDKPSTGYDAVRLALHENDDEAYRMLRQMAPHIPYLPGSEREVDSIYLMRSPAEHSLYGDSLLKGRGATDECFCHLAAQDYDIVHLATHGFFIGDTENGTDLKPLVVDKSMSQSGLLFAGAAAQLTTPLSDDPLGVPTNSAASSQGSTVRRSDGILTAKEMASQAFDNVSLMVLSACQTAQGYITPDGVYGIQRGLKAAGVQAMIVSLWSVDDAATCRLMQLFHDELQHNDDIHYAFNKARKRLIEEELTLRRFNAGSMAQNLRRHRMDAPRFANAFILIDAI